MRSCLTQPSPCSALHARAAAPLRRHAAPRPRRGVACSASLLSTVVERARTRAAADQFFLYKLAVDVLIDEIVTVGTNVVARGSVWLWPLEGTLEVACQMVRARSGRRASALMHPRSAVALQLVAFLNDVCLMFGLSPATGPAALMPAHLFQPGPFTVAQRAAAYANRWRLYSCLGALTGLLSYVITGALGSDSAAIVRRLRAVTNLLLHLRLRLLSSRCPTAGGRRWSAAYTSVSQQTRDISSSRAQSWCYIARFRSPRLSLPPFCCVFPITASAASRGLHSLVHCSKFSKHRLEPQEWWPVAAAQPVGRGQRCRKALPSDSAAQGGSLHGCLRLHAAQSRAMLPRRTAMPAAAAGSLRRSWASRVSPTEV